MNCQTFEGIVTELAREQIIEADLRGQAFDHAGRCGVCAVRLQNEQVLTLQLRTLAREMNWEEVSPRIAEELLITFRREQFHKSSASRLHWRHIAVAAAGIVLMVTAFVILRSLKPSASTPDLRAGSANTNQASRIQLEPDAKPANLLLTEGQPVLMNRRTGKSLLTKRFSRKGNEIPAIDTTAISSDRREIVTDFLPLGHTSALGLQDGGQIVRVEMPRSTLVSFGLPINMERYDERLKADVWLGTDGVPRAIRFVEPFNEIMRSGSGPEKKEGNNERRR